MKIKEIKQYIDELILDKIRLWNAKKKADRMHRITGKRYFVILRFDGKLIVVDNNYIDFYNRGIKNKAKRLTIEKLMNLSLYATTSKSIIKREL